MWKENPKPACHSFWKNYKNLCGFPTKTYLSLTPVNPTPDQLYSPCTCICTSGFIHNTHTRYISIYLTYIQWRNFYYHFKNLREYVYNTRKTFGMNKRNFIHFRHRFISWKPPKKDSAYLLLHKWNWMTQYKTWISLLPFKEWHYVTC